MVASHEVKEYCSVLWTFLIQIMKSLKELQNSHRKITNVKCIDMEDNAGTFVSDNKQMYNLYKWKHHGVYGNWGPLILYLTCQNQGWLKMILRYLVPRYIRLCLWLKQHIIVIIWTHVIAIDVFDNMYWSHSPCRESRCQQAATMYRYFGRRRKTDGRSKRYRLCVNVARGFHILMVSLVMLCCVKYTMQFIFDVHRDSILYR